MAVEIERKFLVLGDTWCGAQAVYYCQGYLNSDKQRSVRVRLAGEQGTLTIKGATTGIARQEFEYAIPVSDAQAMLLLCDKPLIEKYRREIPFGNHVWEVDEFLGDNAGLVVAEIELSAEDETFERPAWLGEEVSHDPRYFNSALVRHPFKNW